MQRLNIGHDIETVFLTRWLDSSITWLGGAMQIRASCAMHCVRWLGVRCVSARLLYL